MGSSLGWWLYSRVGHFSVGGHSSGFLSKIIIIIIIIVMTVIIINIIMIIIMIIVEIEAHGL